MVIEPAKAQAHYSVGRGINRITDDTYTPSCIVHPFVICSKGLMCGRNQKFWHNQWLAIWSGGQDVSIWNMRCLLNLSGSVILRLKGSLIHCGRIAREIRSYRQLFVSISIKHCHMTLFVDFRSTLFFLLHHHHRRHCVWSHPPIKCLSSTPEDSECLPKLQPNLLAKLRPSTMLFALPYWTVTSSIWWTIWRATSYMLVSVEAQPPLTNFSHGYSRKRDQQWRGEITRH